MRPTLFLVGFTLLLVLLPSSGLAGEAHPSSVTYQGFAQDGGGTPLSGDHRITVLFRAPSDDRVLRSETHEPVTFEAGSFRVELGQGLPVAKASEADATSLSAREIFARHPEVELEIRIDDKAQSPRVRLLPAGHSQATIAALTGPVGDDEEQHWKGYESRSQQTAIQSATLQPGNAKPSEDSATARSRPFETPIFFLGESRAVRDLPTLVDAGPVPVNSDAVNPPRHEDLFDARGRRHGTSTIKVDDALAESAMGQGRTPAASVNFEGISNINGVLPPDTEGAVGPNHYAQAVNLSFAIFSKAGATLAGPSATNTLWAGFGGPCQSNNSGDAIFLYDEPADRWVLTQFAVSGAQSVCFAVSTTPDPTGTYFLYELPAQRFPDYYKLGIWPDPSNNAYFMTTNSGQQGQYDVYAVDRANLLAGVAPRTAQFFQSFSNLFMPADVDGDTLPPGGSPGLLYTFRDGGEPYFFTPPSDSIDIWEYQVDWTTPANSTLTLAQSIVPPELAEFNWTVCGFFVQNCLPQPGTGQGIDSASWWPMQRLQYRNFGSHETLVGAWTVDVTGTPDHAAPRWFELRRGGARGPGWTVHQQGTYAPDSDHRFMPSISMDGFGNIAVGYSVTSDSTFPSIRYATRAAGDALGTLQAEAELIAGTGSQTSTSGRWGDYASMDVDPADDCTFWFTTEYIQATGNAPWRTRVGAFTVPGCGAMAIAPTTRDVCLADGSTSFDIELLDQFAGTTTDLTFTNCPAGGICSITPAQVVFPATMSTLDIDLTSVSAGSYQTTVTATENGNPGNTTDVPVDIAAFDSIVGSPSLDSPADGAVDQATAVTLSWSALANAVTYDVELATDDAFANIVASTTTSTTSFDVSNLATNTTYYWRVRAENVCNETPWSATRSFTTAPGPGDCVGDTVSAPTFAEGFEAGAPGWTSSGPGDTWQLSGTQVNTGTMAYWAEDVPTSSDQYLVSPTIAVPSTGSQPTLQFWNHQTIESSGGPGACWDGAVLEISTNGGGSWTRIESELLTDPYDGPIEINMASALSGENAWCGDPQGWLNSVVDLTAWAGQNVNFRFRLATDGAVGRIGWFIDDVRVQSCVVTAIFSDGFESGNTNAWSQVNP